VSAGRKNVEILPSKKISVFQALIDSDLRADYWLVRQNAVNAKSKTYPLVRFDVALP
jgi:hypothetical protein